MPGLHLYVYTIRIAAERFSTATAQDISIFWMEKQEMFLTATRSVRESSKHLLLYIKVIWLWEPEIVRYAIGEPKFVPARKTLVTDAITNKTCRACFVSFT